MFSVEKGKLTENFVAKWGPIILVLVFTRSSAVVLANPLLEIGIVMLNLFPLGVLDSQNKLALNFEYFFLLFLFY